MFGIGTWEWVLIIIIALVFLGPDKLPEVARSAGKGMRAVRRALRGLEEEVGPITRPMAELDPRRVFEDAVREQTSAGPELTPEDVAPEADRGEGGAAPPGEEGGGVGATPHPLAEADGRVSSGPPLARPEAAPGEAPAAPEGEA